jgi:hypothetical protein
MSIKTDISQEDYTAFVKHVARTLSAARGDRIVRIFIGICVGLGVGFVLSGLHLRFSPRILPAMVFGAVAGAFLLMVFVTDVSRRQMQRMRPTEDGYIIGPQEVFLEDEGLRQRSGRHQSVFQWSLVRAVAVTEQHVFVMVDSIAGIILPRRAFTSDAEREKFVREIETRSGKVRI